MKPTRLVFLDSLRGLAALYVLAFHLARVPAFKPTVPSWAQAVIDFGGYGVTLFFVLSAFSLCLTMPRHLSHPEPLKSFYISRFFRIAPLFYVLMLATYIWHGLTFGVWHPVQVVILSGSMLYNLVPGHQEGYVWASWTIGVEMLFYLIFPIIYLTLRRYYQISILLLLSIVIGALIPFYTKDSVFINISILKHFPIFLSGMLAFSVYERLRNADRGRSIGAAMLIVGSVGVAFLIWRGGHYYFQALLLPLIVVGLALCPVKLVVNRAMSFAGKISYSIYLIHAPIIWEMSRLYHKIYAHLPNNSSAFALSLISTIVVVIPLAWLLFETIERGGEAIGRKMLKRSDAAPAPGASERLSAAIQETPR